MWVILDGLTSLIPQIARESKYFQNLIEKQNPKFRCICTLNDLSNGHNDSFKVHISPFSILSVHVDHVK